MFFVFILSPLKLIEGIQAKFPRLTYRSSDKDRYKQIDNRQKQIVPRDNFILVLIINCAMSEIGSIIEDIDSKKWKKIKALNICMAKSLAYSLDKVVAAYRATVAELKDIAESNDATDTRNSKCIECISNFESKVNKIKQIKLDADDVDEQKDDVSSEIYRLRLTNNELLLRNENLKEDNLEKDKIISELKKQLNQNESQYFDLQASDKKKKCTIQRGSS